MRVDLLHEHELEWPNYELLPNNFYSNVLGSSIVIPQAHFLYGFTVNNTNASSQFLLIFDLTALPANGAAPAVSMTAPGASDKAVEWIRPRRMFEGIVICNSSTPATKTIGAADCFFDVQYL